MKGKVDLGRLIYEIPLACAISADVPAKRYVLGKHCLIGAKYALRSLATARYANELQINCSKEVKWNILSFPNH